MVLDLISFHTYLFLLLPATIMHIFCVFQLTVYYFILFSNGFVTISLLPSAASLIPWGQRLRVVLPSPVQFFTHSRHSVSTCWWTKMCEESEPESYPSYGHVYHILLWDCNTKPLIHLYLWKLTLVAIRLHCSFIHWTNTDRICFTADITVSTGQSPGGVLLSEKRHVNGNTSLTGILRTEWTIQRGASNLDWPPGGIHLHLSTFGAGKRNLQILCSADFVTAAFLLCCAPVMSNSKKMAAQTLSQLTVMRKQLPSPCMCVEKRRSFCSDPQYFYSEDPGLMLRVAS